MTPEKIQAAIEQFEAAIITGPNSRYETLLGVPVETILEALRVYAAVLVEPSEEAVCAGVEAWHDSKFSVVTIYKKMTAEIVRQAKGE